jgi:hypothetical protein
MPASRDRVPILANLVAALVSFVFLLIAPASFLWLVGPVVDLGTTGPLFIPFSLMMCVLVAFGGSLIFLVIGIGLQAWQQQRPFSSWWPPIVAFPVGCALLLPEALAQEGPLWFWALVGVATAAAFCVHWFALLAAEELMG